MGAFFEELSDFWEEGFGKDLQGADFVGCLDADHFTAQSLLAGFLKRQTRFDLILT